MPKGILYQPENGKPSVNVSYEHCKLLYLISLYALPAKLVSEAENWIREIPLKVIIFEGIISGVLDLDYCPTLVTLSLEDRTRNVYLNISHESISMISELHASGLLSAIKMQSATFLTSVGFQLSLQGLEFLDLIPLDIKEAVDSFAFHTYKSSKKRGASKRYLIQTMYDGEHFMIWTQKGVLKQSTISEPEAVAFVGSPFLPYAFRYSTLTALHSNAMRASECAAGISSLKTKDFVILSQVHVLVSEWIPFGQNQLFALIERTGAAERCKGGMFAAAAESKAASESASMEVSPGLTQVEVLDYDYAKGINFQAHIEMPNSGDDTVQLEELGIHISVDGLCSYGMRVEAVQDRLADAINIDLLARLLVHIQLDTSVLSNDMMSAFQRSIMERIFRGETLNRFKYTVVFCELSNLGNCDISAFVDKGDCEAELNQVLGPIYRAKNVSNMFQVLLGVNGLLVVGRGVRTFEPLILQFVHAQVRMRFLEYLFARTYMIMDDTLNIRKLVANCDANPENLEIARSKYSELTTDLTTCEEVHQFLVLSTQTAEWERDEGLSKLHIDFIESLNTRHYQTVVEQRLVDLKKLVDSSRVNIQNLNESMRRAQHTQCMESFYMMQRSTHGSAVSTASDRKYDAALRVAKNAVLVSFAFILLNRFVSLGDTHFYGGHQGDVDRRLRSNPVLSAVYKLDSLPTLYLALSCGIVAIIVKAKLFYDARQIKNRATFAKTTQKDMWKHCLVENVEAYISKRQIMLQSRFESMGCQLLNSQWKGAATDPVVSSVVVMIVDLTNAVIKSIKITETVRSDCKDSKTTPIETLLLEMQKECCFEEEPVIEEWSEQASANFEPEKSEQASANFEPEKIDAADGRKDDVTIALDGVEAEPEDDSIAITDRSS